MVKKPQYMKALSQISPKTILVIGDVILDQYTYGSSKRISPEAPVPVVLVEKREVRAGGAGNVVLNLKALGMMPRIVGRIGNDIEGKMLQRLLIDADIDCRFLMTDETMKTPAKTRIISGAQQLLRIDDEQQSLISQEVEETLLDNIESFFENVSLVAISDYAKGTLSERFLKKIIEMANKKNIISIVDPKGNDFRKYSGCTIIKPNASEALASFGGEKDLSKATSRIFENMVVDVVMVTRSEKGISLYYPDGVKENYPVVPKEVRDVTGAGDTVLGCIAACLASSLPLSEAVPIANFAASCAIEHLGCAAVTIQDIVFRLLQESPTGKICGIQTFQAVAQSCSLDKLMVIKVMDAKNISHKEIMKLHRLLLQKSREKMAVAYINDPSPDEHFLEFLASLDRIDLVVHHAAGEIKETQLVPHFDEIETVII